MALKDRYDLYYDDAVAGSSTDLKTSGIVPNGRTVRITSFGGYEPSNGDGITGFIALQWGSGGTWDTLRAGGGSFFEPRLGKGLDVEGDGAKRFRLARKNDSSSAKQMAVWLSAIVL